MTDFWIKPDHVFDGHQMRGDIALRIEAGVVAELGPPPPAARPVAGLVSPGFVDLQVNGGGGVLFNAQPDPDGLAAIAAAHRQFGTVAVMPTVITDHPDVLEQAAEAVIASKHRADIIGLHIEGPHISMEKRGTHAAEFIRPLDDRTMNVVERLRNKGVPVMITLAPECATQAQIEALVRRGAVVSLGHTNADAAEIEKALSAGASCATHVFNAMSQMTGREAGAVGAVLNSDCFAGIICDGHHVADEMILLAIRSRPMDDRMFLVSDAMPTVGGPDQFDLYGQTITLTDGRLVNSSGALSGAHVTQAAGVKRLIERVGVPQARALSMATSVPASCIGLPALGHLIGRRTTDVILLDTDSRFVETLDNHLF